VTRQWSGASGVIVVKVVCMVAEVHKVVVAMCWVPEYVGSDVSKVYR
jgi:hypothetical protein